MDESQPDKGLLVLQLGTGSRYPKSEGVIPASRVVASECVDEAGRRHGLAPRSERASTLEMRSRTGEAKAMGCWLELLPIDLVLTPELVQTYFRDVRAPQAVRDVWTRQQAAGLTWKEIYRKDVRIEAVLAGASPQDMASAREPHGLALEIVPVGGEVLRAKVSARFRALASGKPVAGLPVEFVSYRSPIGIWGETDAHGNVQVALPFPGEWLLRSTAFDLPGSDNIWHTRFATLTVQVQ